MPAATDPKFGDGPAPELDYRLCDLPGSRLQFRGPLPSFEEPYIAVLGGNETFGKYVASPYPERLADWVGMPVANLSAPQAGLSLFSEERVLLDIASKARVTVFQVLGAQNMSNRLYGVHARRNDRFVSVSPALREIYPTVDFTEVHFTGHLMNTLANTSEAAFRVVVDELKWAWKQRMRRLLSLIEGEIILLWASSRPPPEETEPFDDCEPVFVDRSMIEELSGGFSDIVDVVIERDRSLTGKIAPAGEREAACRLPGPSAHQQMADALAPVIAERLNGPGRNAARSQPHSFSISSGTAVKRSATRP